MRGLVIFASVAALGALTVFSACGSEPRIYEDSPVDGGGGLETHEPGEFGNGGEEDASLCQGLECQQVDCGGGQETTVTGTFYAPNGTLPLYNGIVYVPNTTPDALAPGASCDVCGAVTGSPVVTTLSDPRGEFSLRNVPVGKNIPLVLQIGKWRRQVTIPEVTACQATKLDAELTRLPRTQSEGDMPHIAVTSGMCDKLGCMLPKIGIDPSEFGVQSDGASKAVHLFKGAMGNGPTGAPAADALWSDKSNMMPYDMLILSCECSEALASKGGNTNAAQFGAMTDYLEAGGRIFTTDYMYTWYRYTPNAAFRSAASIRGGAPAGGNPITIDTSFPKGQALADWLAAVGAGGATITADAVFGNIESVDPAKAQQWATSGNPLAGPRVFTVNLPVDVPVDQQCGKGVHIDLHINQVGSDQVDATYPAGCGSTLKPAENLLAFFFFDLASCIQNDAEPPKPPPVK